MSVLPKKRGAAKQGSRGSSAVLHDLSNKNRVLSERDRTTSAQKRKPSGSGVRHVSRGDMFVAHDENESNTNANTSFAEDAIDFHENRSTIMSNFEEWIKLSTDNKITSKNSWHFALIDYFHDLNVIKDGDNINFQRASATLDGCVKIYSSRVESAASETGKLLSGLATNGGGGGDGEMSRLGNGADAGADADADDADADADDDEIAGSGNGADGRRGRKERRLNRIVESTLVPFDAIRIRKLDAELAIDPLFKKALAEFDEGGAKSLLLNTLNIDAAGRVVFDATTTPMGSGDASSTKGSENSGNSREQEDNTADKTLADENAMDLDMNLDMNLDANANANANANSEVAVDLTRLRGLLYDGPTDLETCVIAPSMPHLKTVLSDVTRARAILTDVNSKFHADEEENRRRMQDQITEYQSQEQDQYQEHDQDYVQDGDNGGYGDMEIGLDAGTDLDENGDRLAAYEEELRRGPDSVPDSDAAHTSFGPAETVLDSDLMAYFDERMKTNWRGPEHWRVARLRSPGGVGQSAISGVGPASASGNSNGADAPKRQKKQQVLIDFFADDDDDGAAIEEMFRKSKSQFHIAKRPEERTSSHRHILPADIQFNSRKLVTLFLKPNKTIRTFARRAKTANSDPAEGAYSSAHTYTDEQFFANKYEEREQEMAEEERQEKLALSFHQAEMEDCENDNFGLNFNDILDGADAPLSEDLGDSKDGFGSQVLTGGRKARPEYVNYSRVAKRVDIKLLKDNIWKSIKVEEDATEVPAEAPAEAAAAPKQISFKEVVDGIGTMYRSEEKKDLSTSFCFICLLHLANEHGLSIAATERNDNLMITGF